MIVSIKYFLFFVRNISIPSIANIRPTENIINTTLRLNSGFRILLTAKNIAIMLNIIRKVKNGCLLFQILITTNPPIDEISHLSGPTFPKGVSVFPGKLMFNLRFFSFNLNPPFWGKMTIAQSKLLN